MNKNKFAITPPMGWNSYDYYDTTVNEEQVKKNAQYMAMHLKEFGYEYIVADIEWYSNDAGTKRKEFQYIPFGDDVMDEFGRFQPSPGRFPSSKSILLLKEHFLPQTWWQIRPRSADGIRICME